MDAPSLIKNFRRYDPQTVVRNANVPNYCVLKLDSKDPQKTFFNIRNCIGHHSWWCYTNSELCFEYGDKTRRSWLLPRSGTFFQYVEINGKLMCFVGDAATSWLSAVITEKTVAEFVRDGEQKFFVEDSWGSLDWMEIKFSDNYVHSLAEISLGLESLIDACLIIYRHVNDHETFDPEVLQICFTKVIVHIWDAFRNNEVLRRVLCAFNPLRQSGRDVLGIDMVENLKNWRQICVRLQVTVKDGTPFEGIHATLLTFVKTAMDMIRILYQENQVIVPYDVRNLPIKLNEWGRRGGRGSFNKPGTQNQGNKEVGGQAHNLGVPSRYPSFVLRDWTFLESQDIIEDLFGMGTLFDDYMMDRLNWTMAQVADAILAKRMAYHPASSPELVKPGQFKGKEDQGDLLMTICSGTGGFTMSMQDVPSASDDEKKWPSNLCAKETLKKCHARSNEPDCTSVPMQIAPTHADFSHPPPRNFLSLHQRLLPTTARCLPPPPPYRLLLSLPLIPSSLTPPVPPSTAATSALRLGAASVSPRSRSIGGVVQSPSRRHRSRLAVTPPQTPLDLASHHVEAGVRQAGSPTLPTGRRRSCAVSVTPTPRIAAAPPQTPWDLAFYHFKAGIGQAVNSCLESAAGRSIVGQHPASFFRSQLPISS